MRRPLPRIALELFDLPLAVLLSSVKVPVPGAVFPLKFRVALVTPPPEQPVMLAEPETADDCVVWLMPGVNVAAR